MPDLMHRDDSRPTRWSREQCRDCGNIVGTAMPRLSNSKGEGDDFIGYLRCETCEATHFYSVNHMTKPERKRVQQCQDKQRVEAEPRNCGGDDRVYMPYGLT